jgi:glycerol-3-phosphate cytidylyltransferase-like family protein
LNVDKQIKQRAQEINSHYVFITGTFDLLDHGHGNLFPGTLKNIEKIELASAIDSRNK